MTMTSLKTACLETEDKLPTTLRLEVIWREKFLISKLTLQVLFDKDKNVIRDYLFYEILHLPWNRANSEPLATQ